MIIGSFQTQRPQYAFKRLSVTAMILSGASTGARQLRPGKIGGVGIEPLFNCTCCQTQGQTSRRRFHGFEIQILYGLVA